MTEIASLLVTIGADISDLKRGLQDTDSSIDRFAGGFSSRLTTIGADVTRLGAGVQQLTAPLRDFGTQGLQTASDFESIMAEISARTGLVGDDLNQVSQFALQMGADTSFSAQQAGEAFLQLLSSGQSTQEAFATLPSVLDAAAASGENLGATADTVTDIMAAFGLPVSDAQRVVDALAQAAGASSADMASLGQGFANVGGVAKAFGLDVDDTAATLAILAENGIKGAEAGTALKSMLLNMTRPTDEVQGEWSALGLSMYDAMGNALPLQDVIADLDSVLDSLPAEEQNEVMQKLAGSYGITALTALRGSISIDKMKDSMSKQASASDVAQARMDTFKGRVDSLFGSVETLMITGLTPLMEDVLTPLAEQATGVINVITDWAAANPELTNTIVAVGGALVILGPALVAVGTAITLAAPAVGVLGFALAALTSPIALVVGAIAGLAFVASQFIDFTALAQDIQTGLGNAISDIESIDFSAIPMILLTGLNDALFEMTDDDFIPPVNAFINSFQTALSVALVTGDFSFMGADTQTAIQNGLAAMDFSGIETEVDTALQTLDFSAVSTTMETHFDDIMALTLGAVGIVFGGPVSIGLGIAKLLSVAIDNDFMGIGTFLDASGISAAVEDAFGDVKADIDAVIQSVFGGGGGDEGIDIGSKFALKNADDLGGDQLSGPLALFVGDLRMGLDALKGIIDSVWSNVQPGIQSIADGISGFIGNLEGTETEGLLRVVTAITGFIGGIAGVALEIGSDVLGTILTAVGESLPAIGAAVSDFVTGVSRIGEGDFGGAVQSIADGLLNLGQSIADFFGIEVDIPDLDTALAGWQSFADSMGVIIQFAGDQISAVFNDIATGIRAFMRDIEEGINRFQIAGADAQMALGINWDANAAARDAAISNLNTIELAQNLETQLNDSMAAGEVTLDPSQFIGVDYAALGSKIADPLLIQDALSQALAQGNQDAVGVLLPLATELGIDTQSIVDQFAASLDTAAAAQIFEASMTADVVVSANTVNVGPLRAAIEQAINAEKLNNLAPGLPQLPGQAAQAVPQLATGGYIQQEGLAYLHAGEQVLNAGETAAYNQGKGGRGGQIGTLVIQTNDAAKLIFDLKVMGIDLEAMAGQT